MDKFESQINKMKHLMSFKGVNESNITSYKKIDHKEIGADNKTYAIIRENTKFVIKESSMDQPLLAEDFEYIGGFNNRKNNSFDSYSLALKQFDLKLRAINEKYARKGAIVESFNPEFYQDAAIKSTDEMKVEINRQRQIMENASKIGISEDKIDMFKYQDYKHEAPEAPKKSNGVAATNGTPFINAVGDTNLNKVTGNANSHEMKDNPFEEEVAEYNQEDKLETTSKSPEEMGKSEKPIFVPKNSIANEKPKAAMKPIVYNQDKVNEGLDDFPEDDNTSQFDNEVEPEENENNEDNDLDSVINDLQKALNTLETLKPNSDDEDVDDEDVDDEDVDDENNLGEEEINTQLHEDDEIDNDNYYPSYADELAKYGVTDLDNDEEKFDEPYNFEPKDAEDSMAFPVPSKVKYVAEDKPNLKDKVFVYGGPGKKGSNKSYIFNIQDEDEEYLVPTQNLKLIKESKNKYNFSTKEREDLARKGDAMKNGSFPIRNKQDLKDAIKSIGRAKNPEATKIFIKKRAKELGMENLLPDTWELTNEDKINDYGHHPKYGKEAMNISGGDKKNGYGNTIGDGDPFDIKLIVDGVMKELKRMNIIKESIPEKKK
jgi:hypothetical protein